MFSTMIRSSQSRSFRRWETIGDISTRRRVKRDEDDSNTEYVSMEENRDSNELNGEPDQDNAMDRFAGICKLDPDYAAEKGLKCFKDHKLCR